MVPSFVPVMVDDGEAPPDNRPPYWSWPDSRFGVVFARGQGKTPRGRCALPKGCMSATDPFLTIAESRSGQMRGGPYMSIKC